jgi:hypothetical protein
MTLASRPTSLSSEITEKRFPKLREYTEAIIEPLFHHVDEELLMPEELVFVLSAAALIAHQRLVLKTDKLPLVEKRK